MGTKGRGLVFQPASFRNCLNSLVDDLQGTLVIKCVQLVRNGFKILFVTFVAYVLGRMGRITSDEYDKKLQELKDKQYRLNVELEEYTKADHQYHIHVGTVLNLARRISEIFDSSEIEEKRAILNFLLQNPTVDGKKLEFRLRKPFDTVLALAHHPFGLALADDFRTIDWRREYPHPSITRDELTKLTCVAG